MTPSEFETFLQEMEPDIRAADRDMREIEALDQKGVAAVGKLTSACPHCPLVSKPVHAINTTDYQTFRPRIEALLEAHKQDIELAASLEKRTAALIKQYGTHVSHREPTTSVDLHVHSVLIEPFPLSGQCIIRAICRMGRRDS